MNFNSIHRNRLIYISLIKLIGKHQGVLYIVGIIINEDNDKIKDGMSF